MSVTPASALSPSTGLAAQHTSVALAAYKPDYKRRYHKKHSFRYRAGRHYKHAPHGWHRYNSRPGNWHTRGCVVVGPIWWCP
jgi:hypothetical protein